METRTLPLHRLPTGNGLSVCLRLFLSAMAAVASRRAERAGPEWIVAMASVYSDALAQDLEIALTGFEERDAPALWGLQVEMVYYARRYAPDLIDMLSKSDIAEIEDVLEFVGTPDPVYPEEADSVRDGEVIKGSVEFLLEKLPKWLRRLIDVIFQALKISRGAY